MQHRLIDWIGGLVREDTGRKAGDELLHLIDPTTLHDVVIDQDVFPEELHLLGHVVKEPTNSLLLRLY